VLVFVVIRKKKETDLPMSDCTINDRGGDTPSVPKGSKPI
jgi:hypothetical protein